MLRVLIADDDARMRWVIREFVAGVASEIFEVSEGAEALAVYSRQRPDWVLMDWRMKPMDGIRATELIRALDPEARIVIVSQYGASDGRALALQAGAYAYVLKENLQELPDLLTRFPAATPLAARPPQHGGPPPENR